MITDLLIFIEVNMASMLTQSEMSFIAIELVTVCSISIIAIAFSLYCYFKFEELQSQQFYMVIRILISDLLYLLVMWTMSLTYFFVEDDLPLVQTHYYLCQFEAFLSNFTIQSSIAWTSIICYNMYLVVCKDDDKVYYYQFLVIGYLMPAFIAYMPFYFGAYGAAFPLSQTNCFFNDYLSTKQVDMFMILFYYSPIWIAFVFNIVLSLIVIYKLHQMVSQMELRARRYFYTLFAYPAILAMCWIVPGIVGFFMTESKVWAFCGQFLCNIIGLLDASCYCYSDIFTKVHFVNFKLELIQHEKESHLPELTIDNIQL